MRPLLALALLLSVPAAAQPDGPYGASPEQYPGQLARLRLAALYPALVPEPDRPIAGAPAERLDAFLKDSAPVLKNARGLTAYLREGLRDPRGIDGAPEWGEAGRLLDAEIPRLARLAAAGEALLREGVPPRKRLLPLPLPPRGKCVDAPERPEFGAADGERLQRALAESAYLCRLRALVETKAWAAAGIRGLDAREKDEEAALERAAAGVRADADRRAAAGQEKARESAEKRLGESPR